MKTFAIVAALAAVLASASAQAGGMPTTHRPGEPLQSGKYCWTYSDSRGNGWWDTCKSAHQFTRTNLQTYTLDMPQGGDGSGNGGGGNR